MTQNTPANSEKSYDIALETPPGYISLGVVGADANSGVEALIGSRLLTNEMVRIRIKNLSTTTASTMTLIVSVLFCKAEFVGEVQI